MLRPYSSYLRLFPWHWECKLLVLLMEAVSSGEMVPDANSDHTSHLYKKVKKKKCLWALKPQAGWTGAVADTAIRQKLSGRTSVWWEVWPHLATSELERTTQLKNVASTPENDFFSPLHSCSGLIQGALRRLAASGEKFQNETWMWIVLESWRV